MEQEHVVNDGHPEEAVVVDPAEYQRLLLADARAKKHLEQIKARNYEHVACDLCNVTMARGNIWRHNQSVAHRNKVAIQKLNLIKGGKITKEQIDELVQLLS